MSNTGAAFIETILVLPILITLLLILHSIHTGYTLRIHNRWLSRYVSTTTLRTGSPPSQEAIKQRFHLTTPHHITSLEETRVRWKKMTLNHGYYLWRPREALFKHPF